MSILFKFYIIFLLAAGNTPSLTFVEQQVKTDYVPDKETAIRIAEAIWLPIYDDQIYQSKPFVARLKNAHVWIVEGTLDKDEVGGVPYIEIQRKDCRILKVYHGK